MSVAALKTHLDDNGLAGAGLLVPALQAEPLAVEAIQPAPCTQGCPAGINVKAYVSLIAESRFAEALEVIRRRCPLPGICGRICHHPCETVCERGKIDAPVAIRSLKRFVADFELAPPEPLPPPERPEKIAIVGSGPAGLSAAYDLRRAGFRVQLFEAEGEPGGMLRYGITAYRLPREVLDAEIDYLCREGLEIRTGCRVGRDLDLEQLLSGGYSAALLAVGAQRGRSLGLDSEENCPEVEDALSFLRRVNDGDRRRIEGRVVVIGGGSTAVEAARSALRLGASSVQILYRRYREELLAADEEIHAAEAEGIGFRFLVAPARVVRENGRFEGLECMRVGLGEPDASGRRRPILIPGSEFVVEAERVLAAIGQEAELDFLPPDVLDQLTQRGRLRIDAKSFQTGLRGVFAAGDAVTGPATVIQAIAAGHRAAESIRHFLEEGRAEIREQRPERRAPAEYGLPDGRALVVDRLHPSMSLPESGREFSEVEQSYDAHSAVNEARRCLRCGPCGECRTCASTCGRRHLLVRLPSGEGRLGGPTMVLRAPGAVALSLDAARPTPARLLQRVRPGILPEFESSEGTQVELLPFRVKIREDLCRSCGTCVEICPFDAIRLPGGNGVDLPAQIEPALCRGCNLCAGVCPTGAARPGALSPSWWQGRLEDLFEAVADESRGSPYVVAACQRRAGAVEGLLEQRGIRMEVVRFRCVGQLNAGMLVELCGRHPRGVLVAGCLTDRCRFGSGARLATAEVARAQTLLKRLGWKAEMILADWSGDRAGDPLDAPIMRMVASDAARSRPAETAEGGGA